MARKIKTGSIHLQNKVQSDLEIKNTTEDTQSQFQDLKKDTLLNLTKKDNALLWDFQNSSSHVPEDTDPLNKDYLEIFREYRSLFDLVSKGIESNERCFREFLDLKIGEYTKTMMERLLFDVVYGSELNRRTGFLTSDGKYDLEKISDILLVLGETIYAKDLMTAYQVGFADLEKYQVERVFELI